MSRSASLLPLALLSAGCASAPDGIWLFHLDPVVEEVCSSSVTHNFLNAWSPEEEQDTSGWTVTETLTESESLFLGLFTSTGLDTAVLVVGNETYLGASASEGSWTFSWTGTTASTEEESHASGYAYTASSTVADSASFSLSFENEHLTGTAAWDDSTVASWAESDTWSEELAAEIGSTGQMPVGGYLVSGDGSGGVVSTTNTYSVLDCAAGLCALDVNEACSASTSVEAERTDLEADEAWDGVQGAGQAAGAS